MKLSNGNFRPSTWTGNVLAHEYYLNWEPHFRAMDHFLNRVKGEKKFVFEK